MNLVYCDKKCKHQSNGVCIKKDNVITNQFVAKNDCCYFTSITNGKPSH